MKVVRRKSYFSMSPVQIYQLLLIWVQTLNTLLSILLNHAEEYLLQ